MLGYDVLILNGTVIDGSGAPRFLADVAVKDGRIAAIGPLGAVAAKEIVDARGLIVAPGFVDPHTHYDAQVTWDPDLFPSPWHGVTSVVLGNCGYTVAPTRPHDRELIVRMLEAVEGMSLDALEAGMKWSFESYPEYLDYLDERGVRINFAGMIGHSTLRTYVMGRDS